MKQAKRLGITEEHSTKHRRQRVRPKGWKAKKRKLTKQRRKQAVKAGQRKYTPKPKGHRNKRNAHSSRSWR